MANSVELTQELGLEQNDLNKLLAGCGMSEEDYELEILQAAAHLKADNTADNYLHAWCLHIASTHGVELQPIHKAISGEGIETSDDLYHPLFILTCEKVAEGMDPVEAVKSELSDEAMEDDPVIEPSVPREVPDVIKRKVDPIVDLATENSINQVVQVLGELDENTNRYVNARIQMKANEIMQRPEVAALVQKLTANRITPGKPALLDATVVED